MDASGCIKGIKNIGLMGVLPVLYYYTSLAYLIAELSAAARRAVIA
jgi:hypothetical protein